MNAAFYTSFLFLLPAWYSPFIDVSVACVACWLTSAFNHAYDCKNKTISMLDCVVVRAIAAAYVIHALFSIGLNRLTALLLAIAATTLGTYIWLKDKECSYRYHFIVHVLAVVGIFVYIIARHKSRM